MNNAHMDLIWKNYPSEESPVNEENLNRMVRSINLTDENVHNLDSNKATKDEVAPLIADVQFDESTGTFIFIRKDSVRYEARIWDTKLEQLVENLDFDEEAQELIIIRADGKRIRVDVSAFVKPNEFLNSDTILFSIENGGKVRAIVKEGSIEEKHLRPDYLADIRVEQGKAQLSAVKSEEFAKLSESYAHGGTGVREGEDADNAMEYARQAKESADRANNIVSGGLVTGVKGYNEDLYRTGDVSLGMHDILPRNSVNLSDVPVDNSWHDIEIEGILEGINIVKAIVWVKRREEIYFGIYTGMFNWYRQKTEISDFTEEIPLDFSGDMYVPPSQGTTTWPASRFYLRKAWGKDKFPSLQLSIARGISGLSATVELTIINLLSFLHI